MKKWYGYLMASFLALHLIVIYSVVIAGNPLGIKTIAGNNPPVVKWTVKNAFERKVFIENKGQYEIPGKVNSGSILYGAWQGGLQYYFTANSIWMMRGVLVKRTKQEIEKLERQTGEKNAPKGEKDEDELQYKLVEEFHEMSFIGANPEADITPDSEVSWYYNFSINKNVPVKAQAWEKLTYKNLYPGIDMEFYFPEDKPGFKYVFIVHPGADASQIKIRYPLDKSVKLTSEGNISIQSFYGEFIDNAPIATQENSPQAINCQFTLNKSSVVQFNTGNYDRNQSLIIDPWTKTPLFGGENNPGFDVDWDDAGNCYVYGGQQATQVSKFSSSGSLLWTYININYQHGVDFGGLTVDRKSQSVYMSEGWNSYGARVIKLNSSGSVVKIVTPDTIINYGRGTTEIWRIKYSSFANLLMMAGAGTNQDSGELFTLDTSLTNFSVVEAFNLSTSQIAFKDIWGMTLDNLGNGYAGIATNSDGPPPGNVMVKCPLPTLKPTLWKQDDGYNFSEAKISYYAIATGNGILLQFNIGDGNAFNGMACSCTNLFTYDSYALKKWSLDSGRLLSIVNLMPDTQVFSYQWGGLTTDDYGNIFLGFNDSVKQYNNNLQLINTIKMDSTIFDVSINLNDSTLYVCGADFVSALSVNPPIPTGKAKVTVTQPTSCVYPYGSATVDTPSVSSPTAITWNTTPQQFGNTAINLAPGNYIVTIDGGCAGIIYDTITIKKAGNDQIDTLSVCQGHSITLTGVPGETNYVWTPSAGISSSTGSSVIASPSVNTTYTVTSTLNGCSDTDQVNLLVNPDPALNVVPSSSSICNGQGVNTFTASGALSYQWSPAMGLNETSGSEITANPSVSTTYTVTGIDTATGCSSSANFDVFIGNQPTVSFTLSSPVPCDPQTIQFANTSTGGSSYLWNFGDDSTSTEMNPQHTYSKAGNYTITLVVTSVPGCTDSTSITDAIQLGSDNVYVPSAFTPGLESNNYFSPNVVCTNSSSYEFKIYNRWGILIYESTDIGMQGWDGKYNGANQPQDTYVYYIELTCNGCKTFKKGNVTLLR